MKQLIVAMVFGMLMVLGGVANAQTVQVPQKQNAEWHGSDINSYYRYTGIDLDLQGGVGYSFDTYSKANNTILGFGRMRIGVLHIPKYPFAIMVGPTIEASNLGVVWGGQAEVMDFGIGVWARAGVGLDYRTHPQLNAALGWSLFGVEVRYAGDGAGIDPYHRESLAVLGVVRIPIGFLGYVASRK